MNRLTLYNRRSPLSDMNRVMNRMQRWMDQSWPFDDEEFGMSGESLSIDMHSDDNTITVNAAVPGLKEEDINIDVNGDILTISGEKKYEHEDQDKERNWHYREIRQGHFSRSVRLPDDVKVDKAEATLENGVLTVTLPKAESSAARKIEVHHKNVITSGNGGKKS
jgi:HSP20 family protein